MGSSVAVERGVGVAVAMAETVGAGVALGVGDAQAVARMLATSNKTYIVKRLVVMLSSLN